MANAGTEDYKGGREEIEDDNNTHLSANDLNLGTEDYRMFKKGQAGSDCARKEVKGDKI